MDGIVSKWLNIYRDGQHYFTAGVPHHSSFWTTNRCYEIWTGVAVWNCAIFKSLCKGPISEMVQDSYNSRPFKNLRLCPPIVAVVFSLVAWQRPVSASTDINTDKLDEFFVEKVERMHAATTVICSPWRSAALQLLWSFHRGSVASVPAFAYQEFHFQPATNVQCELVDVTPTVHDASSSRLCWWQFCLY